jgi:hypothetical protein
MLSTTMLRLTELDSEFGKEKAVTASLHFLRGGYFIFETGGTSKFVTSDDVVAAFAKSKPDSGWLPEGILRHGYCTKGPFFVYLRQPEVVNIYRNKDNFKIPLPHMIVIGVGKAYRILPVKNINKNWVICERFLPNTYKDGNICWGNMTAVEAFPTNAEKIWKLYIASEFNNDLMDQESAKIFSNVIGLDVFPPDQLKTHEISKLDDFLKRLINNSYD